MLRALAPRLRVHAARALHAGGAASENYYKLLGVAERFTVDGDVLADRFKALQRQWHPDKFGLAPPAKRAAAAEMSARLNEAYATLRTPHRRARHLLQIMSPGEQAKTALGAEFLTWVVEMREAIAGAAGDKGRMRGVREEVDEAVSRCLKDLGSAFEKGRLVQAAEETSKLQYLRRMERAIDDYSA